MRTDGQVTAIVGPNGSGKTSLLSALTGYLMPTSDRAAAFGVTLAVQNHHDLAASSEALSVRGPPGCVERAARLAALLKSGAPEALWPAPDKPLEGLKSRPGSSSKCNPNLALPRSR